MMRNIVFFDLKPGADKAKLWQVMNEVAGYLLAKGCIERRTLRFHDARDSSLEPILSGEPQYMNEELWPTVESADAALAAMPEDLRAKRSGLRQMVQIRKAIRYVEEE